MISAQRHRRFPRALPPMSRRRMSRCRVSESLLLGALEEKPVDESARVGRIPVGGGHQLFPDDAISADDERLRITRDIVRLSDLRLGIVENLEGETILPGKGGDVCLGAGVVDANRHDLQALRSVIFVQRLDARHLHAARQAPRRPDVDHEDLAAIIGEGPLAGHRVEGVGGELWRFATELDRKELVPEVMCGAVRDSRRYADDERTDRQLSSAGHAWAVQRLRRSSISACGFLAAKMALPATKVSAPASHTDLIVFLSMPPSTSRNALLRFSSSS